MKSDLCKVRFSVSLMSHLMAKLCMSYSCPVDRGPMYLSCLMQHLILKIDIRFVSDQIDIDKVSLLFEIYLQITDLIFCQKYQSSRHAYILPTCSSLANRGSLMMVWLSCHQHGHATIAPTQHRQSRPWHQRHLSTSN